MFEKASVIQGHHVCTRLYGLLSLVNTYVTLKIEDGNAHDEHTVAVIKDGSVVGHVPRSLSTISWYFLKRGGRILCHVTGRRNVGVGLEIPCVYVYCVCARNVQKLRIIG